MPPPSSGGVAVMQSLKMLERFNLKNYDIYNPYDVHLTASAMRLAYADRNKYLADPDYVAVPTEHLLSETYLRQRSSLIDAKRAAEIVTPGDPSESVNQYASLNTYEPPSTTHMSIVDADGNAVSFTSTIERAFGSGLATKSGFLLNNQMTDFDFVTSKNDIPVLNRIDGNKRPRSSMAPFFIFNKENKLTGVIGSPGGARIIAFVLPKILYMLHTNKPLNEIINTPNFTAMMPDAVMEVEAGVELKELNSKLEKFNYTPYLSDLNSGIHAIQIKDNMLYGAADPRREGVAMGE
jgi:gamma-glutamyltranspeptidase/glutathione hydrolase